MAGGRQLSDAERLDWLQLIRSENVGPVTFAQLLRRFGSARSALEALPDLAKRGGRSRPIRIAPRASVERELAGLTKIGARLIALGEPDYPLPLAVIADAPPLIAVRGRAELLLRPIVAMVGTRNASTNGRRFAAALARDLSSKGLTVASGLARGIDAAAHDGALAPGAEGAGTIAVVAGGVDVVYPRENAALTERIAAEGVIVAEQPLGLQPQARHFPHRNRLISGLARAVVVVEAALRSGSLITARLAAEQGRDVLAVPGSPLDPRARGSNSLIRDGAWLVESVEDVLAALGPLDAPQTPLMKGSRGGQGGPRASTGGVGHPTDPDPAPIPSEAFQPGSESSEGDRDKILEILGYSPSTVDDLVRRTHLSAAAVAAALLELELAGRVERHSGGQISLIISTV
jgi:DNA processing protein